MSISFSQLKLAKKKEITKEIHSKNVSVLRLIQLIFKGFIQLDNPPQRSIIHL